VATAAHSAPCQRTLANVRKGHTHRGRSGGGSDHQIEDSEEWGSGASLPTAFTRRTCKRRRYALSRTSRVLPACGLRAGPPPAGGTAGKAGLGAAGKRALLLRRRAVGLVGLSAETRAISLQVSGYSATPHHLMLCVQTSPVQAHGGHGEIKCENRAAGVPYDCGGAVSEKCGPWITTSKQEISLACFADMLWFALN
jgi:hypothetical protein